MDKLELVIGNKAYSGWSMRPWLALKHTGAEFRETRVPLYIPGYKERVLEHAPSGKVPVLKHGAVRVWESLAVCEYLAEVFPESGLWPEAPAARALARTVSAEMHAGFGAIRKTLPFNCRARHRRVAVGDEVQQEIHRVLTLWRGCRETHGAGGPWLFGRFSVADAMFIPMALRLHTYDVPMDASGRVYTEVVLTHPSVREWIAAAERETEVMEDNEVGR